jgi:hypothetical protein
MGSYFMIKQNIDICSSAICRRPIDFVSQGFRPQLEKSIVFGGTGVCRLYKSWLHYVSCTS